MTLCSGVMGSLITKDFKSKGDKGSAEKMYL